MNKVEIISLNPANWKQYRDLRLRALKEEPQAFGSTYEENAQRPDQFWQERLEDTHAKNTQWLVFAKLDGILVGMVGAFAEREPDNAHIIGVYVVSEARGKGISKMLMNELLKRIKTNPNVKKVTLDVNPEQEAALNLYKSLGLQVIKQYKMVLGDGKEHDVYQLQILLDATS